MADTREADVLAEADAAVADAKDHFIANQGPLQPGGPFCVRDHISCGGVISRKVPARSAAKLNRPPSHLPSADGAEDLVGDGCGEAGVVVGGDAIAENDDLVADMDAWYVAVAEALSAPLATLDIRLTKAPGPHCRFLVSEPSS